MNRRAVLIMVGVLGLALILLFAGECGYDELDSLRTMEGAVASVREDFPKLEPIRPKALSDLLGAGASALLIDARGRDEYSLSRIEGSENHDSPGSVKARLAELEKKPENIIVYGALGFRSAELAEELRESGIDGIAHLEGGIFAWANAGFPLVDANGDATLLVHPFNRIWGRLLDEERRALLPE